MKYIVELDIKTREQVSSYKLPDEESIVESKDRVSMEVSEQDYELLSNKDWKINTQNWLKDKVKSDILNVEIADKLIAIQNSKNIDSKLQEMATNELAKEMIK